MSKSVLCRAVRGDAEPTPGYILEELVRMSFVSRGVCAEVEGFLLNALEQKHKQADVYVKLKALRALRYLCEKGSSEFRISLRCKASQVKPFVTYTGESDPLHGDSLIKQVRAEAGKCISAIYGDEALSRQKQTNDGCEKTFSESQFYCYTPTNNSSTNPPAGTLVSSAAEVSDFAYVQRHLVRSDTRARLLRRQRPRGVATVINCPRSP